MSPGSSLLRKPALGAGGACRAAVLALHDLGLSPIYLVNRDRDELHDVVAHFAAVDPTVTLCPLYTMDEWIQLRETASPVVAGVSAIPAVEPVSDAEKIVRVFHACLLCEALTVLLPRCGSLRARSSGTRVS